MFPGYCWVMQRCLNTGIPLLGCGVCTSAMIHNISWLSKMWDARKSPHNQQKETTHTVNMGPCFQEDNFGESQGKMKHGEKHNMAK